MKDNILIVDQQLRQEKAELLTRLSCIEQAIRAMDGLIPRKYVPRNMPRGRRPSNQTNLKDLVNQILKEGPMTRKEIMEKVLKTGHTFKTNKPINSLSWILYNPTLYQCIKDKTRKRGHRYALLK